MLGRTARAWHGVCCEDEYDELRAEALGGGRRRRDAPDAGFALPRAGLSGAGGGVGGRGPGADPGDRVRRGAERHQDAGQDRHRDGRRAATHPAGHARRPDDRVRQHRLGRRGHAGGGLRLHHEALRARGGAAHGRAGPRATRARGGEPAAAPGGRPDRVAGRPDRREPRHARDLRADQEGGPRAQQRAHHRRERDGQGGGGAHDPLPRRAGGEALRPDQLHGDSRGPARERALRARARGLHGGARVQAGAVREGQRRDALPRRDRRHGAGAAGQAAARSPGPRDPACRRDPVGARGRADHRGHQQGSRAGDGGRGLPRGPLLPAQRDSDPDPAAARSAR